VTTTTLSTLRTNTRLPYRQTYVEYRKLTSTPAVYVASGVMVGLAVVGLLTNVLLAGTNGQPALGTTANVSKSLSVSALTGTTMLILGILVMAGEFRHRTILATYLGEPHKGRVLVAKLVLMGVLGLVVGAVVFGLTLGMAIPLYAAKGVHTLPLDIGRYWLGATLATGCYALLGVAVGALVRNTVGAVIGALVWVQVVEQLILANIFPELAKWLPTGAAVGLTVPANPGQDVLSPGIALLVLLGWTVLISVVATAVNARRELR
jgi:ABC-2 type transport system permease protein